jgi:hypothetical protein
MPNITHTTLSNLCLFDFGGGSAYLEALLSHMNTSLLKTFNVTFFNQLSFSAPHLCQFVTTIENMKLSKVQFLFYHKAVAIFMYLSESALFPPIPFVLAATILTGR